MAKLICGIDNGVSGSIGIICEDGSVHFHLTPVKKTLNYTKTKSWLNRIDVVKLEEILTALPVENSHVYLERPMVNPGRFKATVSALRALEATLIVIERLKLPLTYEDSKEWQKEMLPKGLEGTDELKAASLAIGNRLWPSVKFKSDADALLMAEWARRKFV